MTSEIFDEKAGRVFEIVAPGFQRVVIFVLSLSRVYLIIGQISQ